MITIPVFHTLEEAFFYCLDMDASLRERLDMFSAVARRLRPAMQDAVDRLVVRLAATDVGAAAPQVGDPMPDFTLPDERGKLVNLANLLRIGPVAITFHRGHWCQYCRTNTTALAEAQTKIAAEGAQIVAIMPDCQNFAAAFKAEAKVHYPALTDMENGYSLSLNLAGFVGAELQDLIAASERDLPRYQGNDSWMLPLQASFVVDCDGFVQALHRPRLPQAYGDRGSARRSAQGAPPILSW